MTPSEFAAKWSASTAKDSAGAKKLFIGLAHPGSPASIAERAGLDLPPPIVMFERTVVLSEEANWQP